MLGLEIKEANDDYWLYITKLTMLRSMFMTFIIHLSVRITYKVAKNAATFYFGFFEVVSFLQYQTSLTVSHVINVS
jgi:hypothetical protein